MRNAEGTCQDQASGNPKILGTNVAQFALAIQFHIALGKTGDLDEIWVLKARRPSAIEVSEPDAPLK
jgi:hypothetical protein